MLKVRRALRQLRQFKGLRERLQANRDKLWMSFRYRYPRSHGNEVKTMAFPALYVRPWPKSYIRLLMNADAAELRRLCPEGMMVAEAVVRSGQNAEWRPIRSKTSD